ncbi:MAG: enoyl-CoA hydratase/isomerase family protein [Candidatus Dormibacteraeota bacterium]|nr:enoyl-CoA hydratase/isomerase family protein [Candidatus Dormibacteraeota bacterium]
MIRYVWLDRPEKRNALRVADLARLRLEVLAGVSDPTVAAVLIAGRGPTFCAGVDLNEFASATEESVAALIQELAALCAAVRTASKPVAAAVQGHCVGGALEMAVCCDFRVCTPDAMFSMPEVAIGIPSVIDAALIERHIGLGRAREMILTADAMSAEEALSRGLVNRVVSRDQLLATTEELLGRATRHHPGAIAVQKRLFEEWLDVPYSAGLESSARALAESFRDGVPQERARRMIQRGVGARSNVDGSSPK